MPRLYLVRHGRAAAGWDTDPDPGLDDLGRFQAEQAAQKLASLGPLPVISSPLARCQQTASIIASQWSSAATPTITVEPAVTEIPSPIGVPMGERIPWLREAMAGSWADLGDRYTSYRDAIVGRLVECTVDTVVASHFIAINGAIGNAVRDDTVVIRSLDNCSITVMDIVNGSLVLVEGGHEADTLIR
jgi:broad specificity phosphatase PhoE